jgi:hypothetical protein
MMVECSSGARTESAAFALTYAQPRSHDLSYFARPEAMVGGRIIPPVVSLSNEKLFGANEVTGDLDFFRKLEDEAAGELLLLTVAKPRRVQQDGIHFQGFGYQVI